MQSRGGSVLSKGYFSVSSSSLLIFITVLSLVGNTLTTDIERIQTPNPLNQENTTLPFNFPENSTRSIVTASEELLKTIRNTTFSEAEDMRNSKVNKSYAAVDRNDEESPVLEENVTQVPVTTLLINNNDSKTSEETTILSTTNAFTTLNETTLATTTTTTEIPISTTTLAATTSTTTISSTTVTKNPTTTTITTTTTMEVTDPPETETEESSIATAFTEENDKMPSGIIVLVTMITFAIVAVIGYVSLIVWRRYLEYRYGNRELLVNDLEFDTNDLRHFEL